ncbi:MAG: hypothetical protein QOI79_2617, partial [Mycobacterium sp.]|nr:hypothetical protein [Mycobacterium sp.]
PDGWRDGVGHSPAGNSVDAARLFWPWESLIRFSRVLMVLMVLMVHGTGVKRLRHPVVGGLDLTHGPRPRMG